MRDDDEDVEDDAVPRPLLPSSSHLLLRPCIDSSAASWAEITSQSQAVPADPVLLMRDQAVSECKAYGFQSNSKPSSVCV